MRRLFMLSFGIKLILCPLAVILSSYIFPGIRYPFLYQPIAIGVVLAGAGTIIESAFLRRGTLWITTGVEFIMFALLIYFLTLAFRGADITFSAAILTAAIVIIIEYSIHRWLIRNRETLKSQK
ncbi:hypothetical protein [Aneurinibacillus tyrosinisolvens]|uniref:hypothetical protein n=1 Tax=Aneurinibacillus tyrosinisolvens TaxID=1443435 RepID=UPI00128C0273|nr:hypothetical protein [Aneurinibacillus tyrosinisolvens]